MSFDVSGRASCPRSCAPPLRRALVVLSCLGLCMSSLVSVAQRAPSATGAAPAPLQQQIIERLRRLTAVGDNSFRAMTALALDYAGKLSSEGKETEYDGFETKLLDLLDDAAGGGNACPPTPLSSGAAKVLGELSVPWGAKLNEDTRKKRRDNLSCQFKAARDKGKTDQALSFDRALMNSEGLFRSAVLKKENEGTAAGGNKDSYAKHLAEMEKLLTSAARYGDSGYAPRVTFFLGLVYQSLALTEFDPESEVALVSNNEKSKKHLDKSNAEFDKLLMSLDDPKHFGAGNALVRQADARFQRAVNHWLLGNTDEANTDLLELREKPCLSTVEDGRTEGTAFLDHVYIERPLQFPPYWKGSDDKLQEFADLHRFFNPRDLAAYTRCVLDEDKNGNDQRARRFVDLIARLAVFQNHDYRVVVKTVLESDAQRELDEVNKNSLSQQAEAEFENARKKFEEQGKKYQTTCLDKLLQAAPQAGGSASLDGPESSDKKCLASLPEGTQVWSLNRIDGPRGLAAIAVSEGVTEELGTSLIKKFGELVNDYRGAYLSRPRIQD